MLLTHLSRNRESLWMYCRLFRFYGGLTWAMRQPKDEGWLWGGTLREKIVNAWRASGVDPFGGRLPEWWMWWMGIDGKWMDCMYRRFLRQEKKKNRKRGKF